MVGLVTEGYVGLFRLIEVLKVEFRVPLLELSPVLSVRYNRKVFIFLTHRGTGYTLLRLLTLSGRTFRCKNENLVLPYLVLAHRTAHLLGTALTNEFARGCYI